jgi:hypothetical protein
MSIQKKFLAGCFLLFSLAAVPAAGQVTNTATDYVAKRIQLTLLNPPQLVPTASISVSGGPGSATYYYWIVATTAIGNTSPAGPFPAYNAPSTLSGGNFNQIFWTTVPNALTYDVLRTSGTAPPFGACACAVATAVAGNTTNDQANALNAYTVTTLDPSTLTITLTNNAGILTETGSPAMPAALLKLLNGFQGLDYLGSTVLPVSAASSSTVTFTDQAGNVVGKDYILCRGRITGYAPADIAMWVLDGDVAPALSSVNFCSSGCSAAAAGIPMGDAAITVGRITEIECTNVLNKNKLCNIRHGWESTSSIVFNSLALGYAQWFSTTAQITSVKLQTLGGNNMFSNSGFVCFGKNF